MRSDGSGQQSRMTVLNQVGLNVYGAVARSQRLIDNVEALLGGASHSASGISEEVYLYHQKVITKEPQVSGRWEWHQDFGYWY